jgi:hypothetical protein
VDNSLARWITQAAGAADDELEVLDDEVSFAPPVDEPESDLPASDLPESDLPESDLPESLFESVPAATPPPPERLSVR